ncbi:helix-turn-helix domain-containing protein [Qipengyuania sp. 1NDH17]|uniref:Helix-turn-helix domain-containing protein n=1 Tax=Qipengyuania polymorpha TaxID=2867234 RepID=A0ABS7IZ78_9SPHN|nr:helix-turn-helix domain-containing protein [Qipengyuania polymorpha]MBX7458872.1 helix-turn-helix domain-containing protein [Qipengyuania polymorpha]
MSEGNTTGAVPQVAVRFFAPPDDLAPCFTTFYKMEVRPPRGKILSDYLQPEWSNLRFFMGEPPHAYPPEGGDAVTSSFQATGPSSLPMRFELPATSMWGIGLLPLGWARYMAAPADEFANTICDGHQSEVFSRFTPLHNALCSGGENDAAQFALITEFFRDLAPMPRDASRILKVHEAMVDPYLIEVGTLAERVGITTRTLERLCRRHFGFPPRLLLRRQRMMRSLAAFMLSDGKSWTETIDRHYHDQAHFVHEFHTFMGMSPTQYAAMPHPVLAAFMEERQRVWGSPVQTLDTPRHFEPDDEAE